MASQKAIMFALSVGILLFFYALVVEIHKQRVDMTAVQRADRKKLK